MLPERKLLIAGSALVLCLALVAGIRATPAAVGGFGHCFTPAEISEAEGEMFRASSTVAALKTRGVADEKIVTKYRREIALFERMVVRGTLSASAAVDRATVAVTSASSTLAAAEAKQKKFASLEGRDGRARALGAAQEVAKAKKALATANAALAKAKKSLETAQAKESAERERLAEPLAASARLTALNVELEVARDELSAATARYEQAAAQLCEGEEVEVLATFVSSDARLASSDPHVADEGIFEITVSLEARGGDAWIIPSRYPTGLPQGDIYPFRTIPDDFRPSFGEYEIVAADGRGSFDQASSYRIAEGESRMFRLTLPVAHGAAGCADAAVGWEYIRWASKPPTKDAEEKLALIDYRNFRTESLSLCSAPTYIDVELSSVREDRREGSVAGDADTVEFQIGFDVTAVGGDVLIDGDVDRDGATGDGLAWSMTPDSTTGTSTLSAVLNVLDRGDSADGNVSGNRHFKIADGSTRSFRFTVVVPAGTDASAAGVMLSALRWGTEPADLLSNHKGLGEDFQTKTVTGLFIR